MALGLDLGVAYALTGPSGARAAFNDPTDTDFVGYLSNVTGLDSPEVRENADVLTEGDGGIHGNFYYGRRPFTLEGMIWPDSATQRNVRMDKLRQASDALRSDATLSWVPTGGSAVQIKGRRQMPARVSNDGRLKNFQLGLVAADPRIYGQASRSSQVVVSTITAAGLASPLRSPLVSGQAIGGELTVSNAGTAPSPPVLTIYGAGVNPTIRNVTNGGVLNLAYTLGATEFLVIDAINKTVLLNNSASRYSALTFSTSNWFNLDPGDNVIRLEWASVSAGASLTVTWRDAWW